MPSTGVPASVPIEGVIFDLHHTLVDQGDSGRWLELAWRHAGHAGVTAQTLDPRLRSELCAVLDHVWEIARDLDPAARRDLDQATHERVFHTVLSRVPGLDRGLATALYATLPDTWVPYEDTLPVLEALHERGCRVSVLSNVGFDVRPLLKRIGVAELVAGLALSYELGAVKPDPAIFTRALELTGVAATRTLMVGDSFTDDAAAAALGIRALIIPPSRERIHGLETVLRLVG
jgi:HAD superfamily hydrolase (TIGR01509 family)